MLPTIHPHIKIGSRNLVGHTHRFREAAASLQGDQALIKGKNYGLNGIGNN